MNTETTKHICRCIMWVGIAYCLSQAVIAIYGQPRKPMFDVPQPPAVDWQENVEE